MNDAVSDDEPVLLARGLVKMRNWHTAALPPLLEPIILLLAFGFGLGAFIPSFAWRGQSSRHPEDYSSHGCLPSATHWLTLLRELGLRRTPETFMPRA